MLSRSVATGCVCDGVRAGIGLDAASEDFIKRIK